MTGTQAATSTRLEKAALDNGFDQELPAAGGWLGFASTHAPLQVWLAVDEEGGPLVALSRWDVARALTHGAASLAMPLPAGATSAHAVPDLVMLHRFLRRAWQLARTLPDELLHAFEHQTAALPRTTEAERLVVQRVGQELFRAGLLDYWEGRCAVTGLAVPELLRASHIRPWADCDTDAERLDVFNGLLLAPHLDAAFDRGYITVADGGDVTVSQALSGAARSVMGLAGALVVRGLSEGHRRYLAWHRAKVFKGS
jgi:hypothetical protein